MDEVAKDGEGDNTCDICGKPSGNDHVCKEHSDCLMRAYDMMGTELNDAYNKAKQRYMEAYNLKSLSKEEDTAIEFGFGDGMRFVASLRDRKRRERSAKSV